MTAPREAWDLQVRIARAADVRDEAEREGFADLAERAAETLEVLLRELEERLTLDLGGRALCPECDPSVLRTTMPAARRLIRACPWHALPLIRLRARLQTSGSAGSGPPTASRRSAPSETKRSGSFSSTSSAGSKRQSSTLRGHQLWRGVPPAEEREPSEP